MKNYFLTALICLSLFACKKKEPPIQVDGTPIFKFIGTIDGDSVNYQAGIDRMYMYTGFYKDTQSLMTVKSYFGKDNCTNCEPYLSFEVKDFDVTNTNGLAGTLLDLLKGGMASFNSFSLDSVVTTHAVEQFTFIPENINAASAYNWDFGDGSVSNLMSPKYIFSQGGMRNVRLTLQSGGLTDSLTNVINTDMGSTCRAQFTTQIDTFMGNAVIVNASSSGFTYNWDFGNGSLGAGFSDSVVYASSGVFVITMTANGPSCTAVYKKKVNFSVFPQVLANYSYEVDNVTITELVPRVNKSAFIITWIKDGVEYRSYKNVHGLNQSGNPVFTFTGVIPYKANENGDPTVKVTGTIDTYLYNKNNWQDSIKIKSNEIVLAAAYPG